MRLAFVVRLALGGVLFTDVLDPGTVWRVASGLGGDFDGRPDPPWEAFPGRGGARGRAVC